MPPSPRSHRRRRPRSRSSTTSAGPCGPPDRPGSTPRARDENRKHWREADDLAAVSQITPEVRRTLRRRARYERLNNCFAAGIVRTVVADTVGRGARLQMLTDDANLNAAVEDLWRVWAAAADWPLTSRILVGVEFVAGECFGGFRDSKRLDRLGLSVTLDVKLIEPDQVADPAGFFTNRENDDDGIECDEDGEVVAYRVLKRHPGDMRAFWSEKADRVDARNMVHWFRPERPGQLRGVTQLAPALPILPQLRRFTSATLTAAETAAMLAGILELPDGTLDNPDQPVTYDTMDTLEIVKGMLLTVPGGGRVTQFRPEQPTTNYDLFVSAKLRELGRAINMPFGKVAGDHSRYNYSSGRMDDAPYWSDRDIHRQGLEAKVFDPVLYKWFDFARFAIPGLVRYEGAWWKLRHRWQYDARPVFDPVKDASADEINPRAASVAVHAGDTTPLISGFSFSIQAPRIHLTQSIATVSRTKRGGGTALDFLGRIGVDKDLKVQGVDLPVEPAFTFSRTWGRATVTIGYYKALAGRKNSAPFYGFAAGEVCFLRANGNFARGEGWSITAEFGVKFNETGISICTGLPTSPDVINNRGWDYLWILDEEIKILNNTIVVPGAAYVEEVLQDGAFSLTEIGA